MKIIEWFFRLETILSLIIALITILLWVKGFLRYLYYFISFKILNRKSYNLGLIYIDKFKKEPKDMFSYENFKAIKTELKQYNLTKNAFRKHSFKIQVAMPNKPPLSIAVRLDQENIDDGNPFAEDIKRFKIVIKLNLNIHLYWKDLNVISTLSKVISTVESELRKNLFETQPFQQYFICHITRDFQLKDEKTIYKDNKYKEEKKHLNAKITENKKNIHIKGYVIEDLSNLVKKYILKYRKK